MPHFLDTRFSNAERATVSGRGMKRSAWIAQRSGVRDVRTSVGESAKERGLQRQEGMYVQRLDYDVRIQAGLVKKLTPNDQIAILSRTLGITP